MPVLEKNGQARTQSRTPVYPFRQGLSRDVTLRLLSGQFTPSDYKQYLRTDHWQTRKTEAFEHHGRACMLCDCPAGLQVHHRPAGYKALFNENVKRHLVILCSRCHKRHHRK